MKQVTTKRTIMNIIDDHLFSSLSAIPSKTNVAMTPPPSAKTKRIQKSLSVRFLVIFCCSSDTTESVDAIFPNPSSSGLVDCVRFVPGGSAVHLPDTFPSSFGSGSDYGSGAGSDSGSGSNFDVSSTVS